MIKKSRTPASRNPSTMCCKTGLPRTSIIGLGNSSSFRAFACRARLRANRLVDLDHQILIKSPRTNTPIRKLKIGRRFNIPGQAKRSLYNSLSRQKVIKRCRADARLPSRKRPFLVLAMTLVHPVSIWNAGFMRSFRRRNMTMLLVSILFVEPGKYSVDKSPVSAARYFWSNDCHNLIAKPA